MTKKKIKDFLRENWYFLLGILFMTAYVYEKALVDEMRLSFSNLIYTMAPWSSLQVPTAGPLLSDVIDNLIPTINSTLKGPSFYNFWNGAVGLGAPEDISMILYPLYYIYLLPSEIATFVKSYGEFIIAFYSMYFLLREFKARKIPAAVAGLIYTFCSSLVTWHGWPHSDVAMFAPFCFLLMNRMIKEIKIKYAIYFTIVLYLMLVAGMPTFAAYFMYLLGAFVVVKTIATHWNKELKKESIKKIGLIFTLFGVGVIFATLLSFPYTAQLLLSVGENGYVSSRAIQARESLELNYLTSLLYPYLQTDASRHFNEATIYVGAIGIIMLLFTGIGYKEKKNIRFWAIAWIVLVILIFTHGLDFIFVLLPAVNTSIKFRIIVLLNFVTAILAGINLDHLMVHRKYYAKKKYYFLIIMVATVGIWWFLSKDYIGGPINSEASVTVRTVLAIMVSTVALLYAYINTGRKSILGVLCILAMLDLGGFAKEYLPWVDNRAADIPEATDTIEFLQENTQNGERITAVGSWVLFPNTNTFYGLKDIRSHNFINTNYDLWRYFTRLDTWYYTTSTRTAIWEIENYNMLKYLGVRYIASTSEYKAKEYIEDSVIKEAAGYITMDTPLSQIFTIKEDGFRGISVLLATYERIFETEDTLTLSLVDKVSNEMVAEETWLLSNVQDNSFVTLTFPEINNSLDRNYELIITTTVDRDNAITAWKSIDNIYEGHIFLGEEKLEGDLVIEASFENPEVESVFSGTDGLFVDELKEYSDRFQLIETVYVGETENNILGWMETCEYYYNTFMITEEVFSGTEAENTLAYKTKVLTSDIEVNPDYSEILFSPINEEEYITLLKDTDDIVEIEVNVTEPRFVLFNEYYTEDWQVYIDGEKAELIKGNFLMRGVFVEEAGTYVITYKYEPIAVYRLIYIALGTAAVFIIVIIFRKKLQNFVDRVVKGDKK
ncbi:MAG: YfhO family protein [Clostridiales bacterium]|nr:YfhO family protein [Clostridiales bacterium]